MFNFSKRIGIDLGTANSLVYLAGAGIVLNEPTVVAISTDDNKVLAVGNEAKEMLGRTPGNITASRPMRDGVIADYVITEAMIRFFLDKVCGSSRLFKPEVMVCAPAGVTSVEKRAILDATLSAGAKTAFLIDEPLAAAIGARIPIANASGNMIVDIGGGTTEAAVICLGGVVVHSSVRVGGNKIDEAIQIYVRKKYNLIIGERMTEEIKIKAGSAMPQKPNEITKIEVRGRDSVTGLPKSIEVSSEEITLAIHEILLKIIGAIKGVLEQTPPELASDIIDKGIIMSGGTSLLRNLDRFVTEQTGVPAALAEDPLLCVALGTGTALENLDLYKRSVSKR
ncbi:rod shape-determining protein [Candidatus Daviesbacteria bacterium RIFCSPHIGHO2_12_FULL_37_11]|uniref:Cell shape-determining protein MreB n=1 Tax=Candidatus Daviesbacteria bacterium RIFCSPHIGHO2_12_FULL_37_11 TaxID=1797777 RepID=A0A1F5KDJ2_9BACT|nr:MAG: rod shape-determining protein [Candidatus Daviesbacteria bacterium RIFCSPHIGHO2_01_FULL_37_27]OGE38934.1 MAG: rod shape-determining protein [Candidatus Daviesbacteria bacterium RIFCSPHIGHO2_12_FULL_37_11]